MNVRPAMDTRVPEAVPPWTGSLTQGAGDHAGVLDGATITGTAGRRHLSVRIGLWLDDGGALRKARWCTSADPVLRAYAEAACSVLETGTDPARLDGTLLRSRVQGVTPGHSDLADLVAGAVHAAAMLSPATRR